MKHRTLAVASLAVAPHSIAVEPWFVEEHSRRGVDVSSATFSPIGYEPGYAYPLLVWLHGSGSDEQTLPQVMRHVSVRNYVAAAPRGPAEAAAGGYGWRQTTDGIADAGHAIDAAIGAATEQFHVHPDRVFLAGVGAGGTMALRLALASPHRFAGAASIDGALPRGHRPLRHVNVARGVPLLLSASRLSQRYPESAVCSDLRLLHSAGCQVAVRQYPGDSELTTEMLADLDRWLMQRVCG